MAEPQRSDRSASDEELLADRSKPFPGTTDQNLKSESESGFIGYKYAYTYKEFDSGLECRRTEQTIKNVNTNQKKPRKSIHLPLQNKYYTVLYCYCDTVAGCQRTTGMTQISSNRMLSDEINASY